MALILFAVQVTLHSENFDGGLNGYAPTSSSATVIWDADATPATIVGTPSNVSPPNSLNYNDGTDFDDGTTVTGEVDSPAIDLTGTTGPSLTFQCNYQTEDNLATFDQRFIEVISGGGPVFSEQLVEVGGGPTVGPCSPMGTWHAHTVPLDPTWGVVNIRFRFDSVDGILNAFAGMFIDDVVVTATTVPPEVACADTIDNDFDTLVDCADPDCAADPACAGGGGGGGGGGATGPRVDTRGGGGASGFLPCSSGPRATGSPGFLLLAAAIVLALRRALSCR